MTRTNRQRVLSRATVLIGLAACQSTTDPDGGNPNGPPEPDPRDPVGRVTLTYLPVDPTDLWFAGLGNLNVLPEDHGGFYLPREGWYEAPTIPVRAPAQGRIIRLARDWYPSLAPHGHDLAVAIRVSTTMTVTYAHISDFSPKLWAAVADLEPGYAVWKEVDIEVEAGEILGSAGTQGALDWHIKDSELQLYFANRERYPTEWLIAGCYETYYQEPLRSRLLEITLRAEEPRCGRVDFDVEGRIAGNWFLENEVPTYAFNDLSTHLAIVYDERYGDQIAISDGYALRASSPHPGDERYNAARVFWVEGDQPRPESVGIAQGLVKYAIMDRFHPSPWTTQPPPDPEVVGTFLVQMLDPRRVRVERVMGRLPAEVDGFGANARTYVR